MRIPNKMYAELLRLAVEEAPRELVALLAAKSDDPDTLVSFVKMRNDAVDPRKTFAVQPHAQFKVEQRFDAAGMQLRAVLHSHPNHAALPSKMDLHWHPDDLVMLIASVSHHEIKAYQTVQASGYEATCAELSLQTFEPALAAA